MNPLTWKREHQIALAVATGIGAVAGCSFGALVTPSRIFWEWGRLWCGYGYSCVYLLQGYWLLILFWTALGGCLAGGIVYVRHLLRT